MAAERAAPRGPAENDAIAANLPYIPSADLAELAPEVREWEPRAALDGGPDGLAFIRRLIDQVVERRALVPGGRLFLELGAGQSAAVSRLLADAGLVDVQARLDYAQIPRVVSAAAPARA